MPTYPDTLPLPDHASYAGASTMAAKASPVRTPANDQAVYFNSMRTVLTLTFHMTDTDLQLWMIWLDNEGWDWFDIPLVAPAMPVNITSTQKARCISSAQVQTAGYNWNSVSIQVELVPSGTDDPLAQTRPEIPNVVDPGDISLPNNNLLVDTENFASSAWEKQGGSSVQDMGDGWWRYSSSVATTVSLTQYSDIIQGETYEIGAMFRMKSAIGTDYRLAIAEYSTGWLGANSADLDFISVDSTDAFTVSAQRTMSNALTTRVRFAVQIVNPGSGGAYIEVKNPYTRQIGGVSGGPALDVIDPGTPAAPSTPDQYRANIWYFED